MQKGGLHMPLRTLKPESYLAAPDTDALDDDGPAIVEQRLFNRQPIFNGQLDRCWGVPIAGGGIGKLFRCEIPLFENGQVSHSDWRAQRIQQNRSNRLLRCMFAASA